MQKITPCLWFDDQAEEAVKFYTSIFKNSKIGTTAYYNEESSKASGRPGGSVMTIAFELDGQKYLALNGGPIFKFTHAISLMVNCETQEELDRMWEKLSEGGEIEQCGWLRDKYGLSWQVVPTTLNEMMQDPESTKSQRVMGAVRGMKKLDIAALQNAYEGR